MENTSPFSPGKVLAQPAPFLQLVIASPPSRSEKHRRAKEDQGWNNPCPRHLYGRAESVIVGYPLSKKVGELTLFSVPGKKGSIWKMIKRIWL